MPAPATATATDPVRQPVTRPQLEAEPAPVQPPAGCAGLSVPVSLQVGEDGRVHSCRILKNDVPIPAECRKAAEAIALGLRFRPALDAQGRPVADSFAMSIILPEAP